MLRSADLELAASTAAEQHVRLSSREAQADLTWRLGRLCAGVRSFDRWAYRMRKLSSFASSMWHVQGDCSVKQSALTLAVTGTVGCQSGFIQDQPGTVCCRQVAVPYDLDSTAILADTVRERLRRQVATLWVDNLVFAHKGPPLQLQWQDSEAGLAGVFRRGAAAPAHMSDRSAASCCCVNKQQQDMQAGWQLAPSTHRYGR